MKYKITKLFIGGILENLMIEEETNVEFEIGFTCNNPAGGSPYRIIDVKEIV